MTTRKITTKELLSVLGSNTMSVVELAAACKAAYPHLDCSTSVVSWRMMSMKESPYVALDISGSLARRRYRVVSIQNRFLAACEKSQAIADGKPAAPIPHHGEARETAEFLARAAQLHKIMNARHQRDKDTM